MLKICNLACKMGKHQRMFSGSDARSANQHAQPGALNMNK